MVDGSGLPVVPARSDAPFISADADMHRVQGIYK
jgi:hypothetical protein